MCTGPGKSRQPQARGRRKMAGGLPLLGTAATLCPVVPPAEQLRTPAAASNHDSPWQESVATMQPMPALQIDADHARRFLVTRHLLAPARSLPARPESVLDVVDRLGPAPVRPARGARRAQPRPGPARADRRLPARMVRPMAVRRGPPPHRALQQEPEPAADAGAAALLDQLGAIERVLHRSHPQGAGGRREGDPARAEDRTGRSRRPRSASTATPSTGGGRRREPAGR